MHSRFSESSAGLIASNFAVHRVSPGEPARSNRSGWYVSHMRDPLGLNERVFSWYYPRLAKFAEKAGLGLIRHDLLAQAAGRTVDIGSGNGINLDHYPGTVTDLLLVEPSIHMIDHLTHTVALRSESLTAAPIRAAIIQATAEALPIADSSFDTAVTSLVLCSVPDPDAALAEVARVLRPGGRLLFIEHVRAEDGSVLGSVQDIVEKPHRYLAAGCFPNRRTEELIESSPLEIERIEHTVHPRSFLTVRPMIVGSAIAGKVS